MAMRIVSVLLTLPVIEPVRAGTALPVSDTGVPAAPHATAAGDGCWRHADVALGACGLNERAAEAEDALLDMLWPGAAPRCSMVMMLPERDWWIRGSENRFEACGL